MNYIRDYLHNDIEDLFKDFVNDIAEIPFQTEFTNSPEYNLNQNIINHIYNIRRIIELYPENEYYNETDAIDYNETNNIENLDFNLDEHEESDLNTEWSSQSPFNVSLNTHTNLVESLFDILNQSLENTLNNFDNFDNFDNLEDVKVTLSEEEFDKLEIPKDISLLQNKQCNICLDDFSEDDFNAKTLIKLKCNHIYHRCCLKTWLTKQSTKCPVCRTCCKTN